MAEEQQVQIVKCRDDHAPVVLVDADGADVAAPVFRLREGSSSSWAKPGQTVGIDTLRPRIEPWLAALCQSEHFSVLLGSGLTHAVHFIGAAKLLPGMGKADFGEVAKIIDAEAQRSAAKAGRREPNIEDQLRVATELLRGLEILALADDKERGRATALRERTREVLSRFATSILQGEHGLATANVNAREAAFNYLVSFLMSFASRSGTRDRLHVFTTNYDRFIEAGAEVAGLHLLDRFVGTVAPIFRSSRLDLDLHYNPPGIRGEPRYLEGVVRFTKMHGSVDWVQCGETIRRIGAPFGANSLDPYLAAPGLGESDPLRLMIYPNAAKDRETALYPYVELFRDFAAATCRPNHTLVTFGYSFGDDHINRVVEDMLTIPSTHLVVMSRDDKLGRIMKFYDQVGRPAQTTLLVGTHVGSFKELVDNYLPKPTIDRTSFRMAELLKARWGLQQSTAAVETSPSESGSNV